MIVRSAMTSLLGLSLLAAPALAQDKAAFTKGPVFTEYGAVAKVDADLPVGANTHFKVVYNVHEGARPGEVLRAFDTAARFINMNVAAGVPEANIKVALVVHGPAGWDLTSDAAYGAHAKGAANANAKLVRQLLDHGVAIYLCGQSATAMGIHKADLLPGVKMALSAMDAFALLQQQGYVLLP
ncbi:DsrE family protein [Novosphingobium sp. 1949]|uniref:DsrE family protein n=1 Tax=Novosphingobium organovorum TaxID=2930092 RepID=A0ABT0BAP9_9SPHN|nr:DsrE family protein [Novosphingobium organovorum]MCJ2182132.1 DsrE family protein [Novosphingobium organovorum]